MYSTDQRFFGQFLHCGLIKKISGYLTEHITTVGVTVREITISRGTDLRVHLCSDSAKHKHFGFVLGQGSDKGRVVATVYPNRSLGK